jgi:hypothetical protein
MRITTYLMAILFAILAGSATVIAAEENIYRWVDENGVVHFGDRSNAKTDAEVVKINKSPAYTAPSQPAESTDEPNYAQKQREARAKNQQQNAKTRKELAAECDYHRNQVAQLEPMPRVITIQEDGSALRMDDNVRLEKLKASKDFIAKNCD